MIKYMKKIEKIIKNLLLKKKYSLFKKIFTKKKTQTNTTHKSLRKGPLTKNIGNNDIAGGINNQSNNSITLYDCAHKIFTPKIIYIRHRE